MERKFLTLAALLLAVEAASGADIRVSPGIVSDRRSTGEHFNGLQVELKISGDDVAKAKAVKLKITKAVDDTGRDLLKQDDFSRFNSINPDRAKVDINLKNPARKAQTFDVDATLSVLMPQADPDSVVLIENHVALSGKPLENPALAKAGVELRLFTKADFEKLRAEAKAQRDAERKAKSGGGLGGLVKGAVGGLIENTLADAFSGFTEGDLSFLVKDPSFRITQFEFSDAAGKEISPRMSSQSGSARSFSFNGPLPADAKIRIFLSTEKSLVAIPVSLKAVELP